MGKNNRISKRFLSVVLCVMLMLTCVPMTVFADDNTENVSAVYEAYEAVLEALQLGNYEGLDAAVDNFYGVTAVLDELSDAEWEELAVLLGEKDGEAAYEQILYVWGDGYTVVNVADAYFAYTVTPSVKTAKDFVEMMNYYNETYNDGGVFIESFLPDIDLETFIMALWKIARPKMF